MRLMRNRRALAGVVGAVIFIVVFVAGFQLINYGVIVYDNYAQAVIEKNTLEKERLAEEIEIKSATIDGSKFNLTIQNKGQPGSRLVRLWVTNETANPSWHEYFDLNTYVNPGQSVTNLGQNLPLTGSLSKTYALKIVTERGNIAVYKLVSTDYQALKLQLFALQQSIPTNQKTGLILSVTNNMTDGQVVQNIEPSISLTYTALDSTTGIPPKASLLTGPTPVSDDILKEGETALFEWTYLIEGDEGDTVSFNATLKNAKAGNWVKADIGVVVDIFSLQSAVSLASEGLKQSPPDISETLHFHDEYDPWIGAPIHRLESVLENGPEGVKAFKNPSDIVHWNTVNVTETVTIAAGAWNYSIFARCGGGCPVTIELNLTKTNADGSPVSSIWTTQYSTSDEDEKDHLISANLASQTLNIQERLRVTISWVSGGEFEMWWDKKQSNRISTLGTPTQTPPIPSFAVFSGGNVDIIVSNQGPNVLWIDKQSRTTFKKTLTNESYAAIVQSWKNVTLGANPSSGTITSTRDSIRIAVNSTITLVFEEPREIPGRSISSNNPSVTSVPGTYFVYVRLNGYDDTGGFLFKVIKLTYVVVSQN